MHSYVDRGRYSAQIRRLWRWFGKNNVLILKQEELSANPQTTMNKICEFLLIDSCEIGAKITSNQGVQREPLETKIHNELMDSLRGDILSLEKMLEWDCSDWLEAD